jgi:NADH:ubiquinone oxidoreductase subunit E
LEGPEERGEKLVTDQLSQTCCLEDCVEGCTVSIERVRFQPLNKKTVEKFS